MPTILCLETFSSTPNQAAAHIQGISTPVPTQGGQSFAELLATENEILRGEVSSNLGNKQSCAPWYSELTPPTSACAFSCCFI